MFFQPKDRVIYNDQEWIVIATDTDNVEEIQICWLKLVDNYYVYNSKASYLLELSSRNNNVR